MPHPWPIPDLLPTGVTLLAGPADTGKTWLTLNLAMAAVGGCPALGCYPITPGDVLYINLRYPDADTTEAFLKARMLSLSHADRLADITRINFVIETPPLAREGNGYTQKWLAEVLDARLIIINPLSAFGVTPDTVAILHRLALQHHIACLLVCEDVLYSWLHLDAVQGLWILDRCKGADAATLTIINGADPLNRLALTWHEERVQWRLYDPGDNGESPEPRLIQGHRWLH